eukprot:8313444-Alexandrium_andersonii.AAC.1
MSPVNTQDLEQLGFPEGEEATPEAPAATPAATWERLSCFSGCPGVRGHRSGAARRSTTTATTTGTSTA